MLDPIGESARDRLLLSSYSPLRAVACSCRDGVLTLRGLVPTYHQKQLAQAIVAEVEGIREIVNEIQVAGADPRT
jgi:osmotically-inducible protein OsmY